MPTLRQLKALALIAQTGSFTRAAERLFVTQSAVSALIRDLEEEVGVPLIVRGRALRLTAAGEHVQRAGSRAQAELDRAMQELRGTGRWTQTVLRVAAGSLSAATLVAPALARLKATDEGLRIVLIDRPVGMLGDLLLSGEADVAIGSVDSPQRISSELHSELLISDTLCVVASAAGALASRPPRARRRISWGDLQTSELILVGRAGGHWNSLLHEQLAMHPGLRVGYEVQLLSSALSLVRFDLGVAVLPAFAAGDLDRNRYWVGELLSPGSHWNTYWVTRKGVEARTPGTRQLFDALREVAAPLKRPPRRRSGD